jgi:hypothetical protein
MAPRRLLAIYLQDHYAGASAGLALARRAQRENANSSYGDELAGVVAAIESDREQLARIMKSLGVKSDPVKVILARVAERVGRLKPNGRLISYSPLSRLIELEALVIGITGKLALWRTLRDAAGGAQPLRANLDSLIASAEAQRDVVERLRLRAARDAFGEEPHLPVR